MTARIYGHHAVCEKVRPGDAGEPGPVPHLPPLTATWILMVVFLQGCCICSKTELCLPWTESCPALAFRQGQSQFCPVAASQQEQPGESLPETCYLIWAQNFPEFSNGLEQVPDTLWCTWPSGSAAAKPPVGQAWWNVMQLGPGYISWHLPVPWWLLIRTLPITLSCLSWDSAVTRVEILSQPLFSGQAQLHFLWPYQTLCFQNC